MNSQKRFREAQRLHQLGKTDAALRLYDLVVQENPTDGRARIFRALLLSAAKGRVHDAVSEAREGLAALEKPGARELGNAATVYKNGGLILEAQRLVQRALAVDPENISLKSNLATLLMIQGDMARALRTFEDVAERTEEPAPWLNIARIHIRASDFDAAEAALEKAEDRDPGRPDVLFLKARIAYENVDHLRAVKYLNRTLKRQPSHREAWKMLRMIEAKHVDGDLVDDLARRLVRDGSQSVTTLCAAVGCCRHFLAWSHLPELEARLDEALHGPFDRAPSATAVFDLLACNVSQASHCRAAAYAWRSVFGRRGQLPSRSPDGQRDGRLRVAFLSHDFRQHAGGTLVIGLLENLPRTGIEWWAYCNSIEDRSSIRNRARGAFDRFINVARLDDAELAEKIHDDEIDVVIDLNGMTGGSRIGALAYRPAPVQIVWKGMPGSVGTREGVDYIIGDPWVITETNRNGFSESVIRLPRSYQPNDHEAPELDRAGERADHDLPAEGFVFCNFNQLYKLSPDTFARWCEILRQTEGSVLWLLRPKSTALEDRLKALAERSGVEPARIVFAPPIPHGRHVARIKHADLVLDTWPYNAHTTCSDALRAGVPVLTIPGHTFAARVAAGVLDTCGLRDWIAADETAFVDTALAFAARPRAEIDRVKQTVFETYWGSEMVDNAKLGAYFETLCTEVVEQARTGCVADFDIAGDRSIRRSPFGTPETVATDGEIDAPADTNTETDAETAIGADASERASE